MKKTYVIVAWDDCNRDHHPVGVHSDREMAERQARLFESQYAQSWPAYDRWAYADRALRGEPPQVLGHKSCDVAEVDDFS